MGRKPAGLFLALLSKPEFFSGRRRWGGIPKMPVDNTVKREKRFLQYSWLWDGRGRVNEGLGGGGPRTQGWGAACPQETLGSPGAGVLCLGETEAP